LGLGRTEGGRFVFLGRRGGVGGGFWVGGLLGFSWGGVGWLWGVCGVWGGGGGRGWGSEGGGGGGWRGEFFVELGCLFGFFFGL